MHEQEVARLIRKQGWKIAKGPYPNARLAQKGIFMWSIKSVLSTAELKERGITVHKGGKQGDSERTVRFLGEVVEGRLISLRHITSSDRKKIGSKSWRPGRNSRKQAAPTSE